MSLYKRGDVWRHKFRFCGQIIRDSAKTDSKNLARDAERNRRRKLEEGFSGINRRDHAMLFSGAAQNWLDLKRPTLAPRSIIIEKANLQHLLPIFGKSLLSDISAEDISRYQQRRLTEEASPKDINSEVGTLRAILRRHRLWAMIQPDVRMLPTRDDVGRAISEEEEKALLESCAASRSRSLYPAVVIALSTCMRYSEIRLLRLEQIDFGRHTITVGRSKTEAGTGASNPSE